jgi:hypothetical protein
MNYYQFHIGDYQSHTSHLTPMEDLCYRRLIDRYYLSEAHLPLDVTAVARLIGFRDQEQIVSDILSEFFVKSEEGWRSSRCDDEIEKYREKANRARKANDSRWHKKGENRSSDSDADLISETFQIPTNNQEPIVSSTKKKKVADAPVVMPEVLDNLEFATAWQEYISYRSTAGFKTLKRPSIQRTFDEMATWGCDAAIQSLHNSIRNGWQGVFAPRTQANAIPEKNNEFTTAF